MSAKVKNEIWTMGEMIVEIMRTGVDMELSTPNLFQGPYPSGAPAIFIDTVARLGHSAGIIGGVGKDDFGKCIIDRLRKDGVDTSLVLEEAFPSTGVAFVMYKSDGERKFIYHMGNTPAAAAKAPDLQVFEGCRFFHIMGCSLSAKREFGEEIIKAMHGAVEKGAKVSFDPNIREELMRDPATYKLIHDVVEITSILMPGERELMMVTGTDSVDDAVEKAFKNPMLEIIALKQGSRGCTVYTRNQVFSMGVYPSKQVDATGAGDTFDAAFLCGLIESKSVKECAEMASAVAALNVRAFGPMEGDISVDNMRDIILASK